MSNADDRCGKCGKTRYDDVHPDGSWVGTCIFVEPTPQPEPSGDEATVREWDGTIADGYSWLNRTPQECSELGRIIEKRAYAAGKADGRREAEDGYLIDIRQARWGHGDNDAIDDELVRLHNLIIARRGSEGK